MRNQRATLTRTAAALLAAALFFAASLPGPGGVLLGCDADPGPALVVAGSGSMQPVLESLGKGYEQANHGARVKVQAGGSTAGIRGVLEGLADLGAVSRELYPDEKGRLKQTLIAHDSLVVIVNPSNPLEDIGSNLLRAIFGGQVSDWSELGGPPGRINLIAREDGSGTREAFETMVMAGQPTSYRAVVQNSPGAVRGAVAGDRRAIGYISISVLDPSVKALGAYRLTRAFYLVTAGQPAPAAEQFLEYVLSPEGQARVARESLVPVR